MFQSALVTRSDRRPVHVVTMHSTPTAKAMLLEMSGPGDGYLYLPDVELKHFPRVSRRTLKVQEREAEIWDDSAYARSWGYIDDSPLFVDTYVEGRAEGRHENDAVREASCNGIPTPYVTWAGITTCSHCGWVVAPWHARCRTLR